MVKNDIAVYIDGINRTNKVIVPFKFSGILDESLDEAVISLRHVQKELFTPLTPVEIHVTNTVSIQGKTQSTETQVFYFVVSGDAVTESPIGSGLYNHELALVEVTKTAECVVMDTLTITNDIGRTYTENAYAVIPIQTEG